MIKIGTLVVLVKEAPEPSLEAKLAALPRGGRKLGERAQAFAEQVFGQRFPNVSIHEDPISATVAKEIGAKAFTEGTDIYAQPGAVAVESADGRALLAHELAHVIQQGGGKAEGSISSTEEAERQAEGAEKAAREGKRAPRIGRLAAGMCGVMAKTIAMADRASIDVRAFGPRTAGVLVQRLTKEEEQAASKAMEHDQHVKIDNECPLCRKAPKCSSCRENRATEGGGRYCKPCWDNVSSCPGCGKKPCETPGPCGKRSDHFYGNHAEFDAACPTCQSERKQFEDKKQKEKDDSTWDVDPVPNGVTKDQPQEEQVMKHKTDPLNAGGVPHLEAPALANERRALADLVQRKAVLVQRDDVTPAPAGKPITLYDADGTALGGGGIQFFSDGIQINDDRGQGVGFINPAAADGSIAVTSDSGIFGYVKPPPANAPTSSRPGDGVLAPDLDAPTPSGQSGTPDPDGVLTPNLDAPTPSGQSGTPDPDGVLTPNLDAPAPSGQSGKPDPDGVLTPDLDAPAPSGASGQPDADGLLTPDWADQPKQTSGSTTPDPDGVLAPSLKHKTQPAFGDSGLEGPALANEQRVFADLGGSGPVAQASFWDMAKNFAQEQLAKPEVVDKAKEFGAQQLGNLANKGGIVGQIAKAGQQALGGDKGGSGQSQAAAPAGGGPAAAAPPPQQAAQPPQGAQPATPQQGDQPQSGGGQSSIIDVVSKAFEEVIQEYNHAHPGGDATPANPPQKGDTPDQGPQHIDAGAQQAADASQNTGKTVEGGSSKAPAAAPAQQNAPLSPPPAPAQAPPSADDAAKGPSGLGIGLDLSFALQSHKAPEGVRFGPQELEAPAEANEARAFRELTSGVRTGAAATGGKTDESVQRSAAAPATGDPMTIPSGGGERLAGPARDYVEKFFKRSFGDVRIHRDPSAQRAAENLNAHAFTTGKDIYFGAHEFTPGDPKSMALLVHELTHVVQQQQGVARKAIAGVSADAMALQHIWRMEAPIQMRHRHRHQNRPQSAGGGGGIHVAANVSLNIGGGGQQQPQQQQPSGSQAAAPQPAQAAPAAAPPPPRSAGQPLDAHEREQLEARLHADLSQVRLHQDSQAQDSAKSQDAQAYQSGQNIVLGQQAAQKNPAGDRPVVAHEAEHVRQDQAGETRQASRNPFAQWLLEQSAQRVERGAPGLASDFHLGEFLRSPGTLAKVSGWLSQLMGIGEDDHLHPRDPSNQKGSEPPKEKEGEETKNAPENYVHELMHYYGVRPHVGEEEFLDELTERVMDLMNEELLSESERRSVNAPF